MLFHQTTWEIDLEIHLLTLVKTPGDTKVQFLRANHLQLNTTKTSLKTSPSSLKLQKNSRDLSKKHLNNRTDFSSRMLTNKIEIKLKWFLKMIFRKTMKLHQLLNLTSSREMLAIPKTYPLKWSKQMKNRKSKSNSRVALKSMVAGRWRSSRRSPGTYSCPLSRLGSSRKRRCKTSMKISRCSHGKIVLQGTISICSATTI